jgi:hypothetical protein
MSFLVSSLIKLENKSLSQKSHRVLPWYRIIILKIKDDSGLLTQDLTSPASSAGTVFLFWNFSRYDY